MRTCTLPGVGVSIGAGPGSMVPVLALGGLFAAIAARAGLPVVPAALVGGIGGAFSLLLHELGHVCAARSVRGIRPMSIALVLPGAVTRLEGAYRSGRDQAHVAAAGPAASLAFALVLLAVRFVPLSLPIKDVVVMLALLNVAIAVLNLIPVAPLDGHKLVVALVWCRVGSETAARRIVGRCGRAMIAAEAVGAVALFVERPMLGATAGAMASMLFVQRRLAGRLRTSTTRAS